MLVLLTTLALSHAADSSAGAVEAGHHGDRLLVRATQPLVPGSRLVDGATVERALAVDGWYLVSVPGSPLEVLPRVQAHHLIDRAEPDHELVLLDWPDEPAFDDQWALENQPTRGGTWDADLDVLDAWDQGASGLGLVVAVIDTGVDLDHPELAPVLWVNPEEVPANGIDDDRNGYVDDVHGIDAEQSTGDPDDVDGHGTSCAGLIAAQPDGRTSVGLAPDVQIMAIRVLGADRRSFTSIAAEGIAYAAVHGADILSNSWHYGMSQSGVVTDALQMAADRGALVLAAAGNSPVDADETGFYPASTPIDEVMSVGGSTRHDDLLHFPGIWGSAHGWTAVDLTAPAEGVLTTHVGGGYGDFDGTSAATPLAAATAALVWSVAPELSAVDVKQVLIDSTDPNGSDTVAGGRVNAGNAVRLALGGPPPLELAIEGPTEPEWGEVVHYRVEGVDAEYTWFFGDDRSMATGAEVEHTFVGPGPWRVVVEGVAADGSRGRAFLDVSTEIPWMDGPEVHIETPHSGGLAMGVFVVDTGDVVWTRLHFDRISMAAHGWDYHDDSVGILDPDGFFLWSASGEHTDLWTPPLRGGEFLVTWLIDRHAAEPSWGMSIDGSEVWYPTEIDQGDTGEVTATRSCGCAATSGLGPWLLGALLMVRRRRRR